MIMTEKNQLARYLTLYQAKNSTSNVKQYDDTVGHDVSNNQHFMLFMFLYSNILFLQVLPVYYSTFGMNQDDHEVADSVRY